MTLSGYPDDLLKLERGGSVTGIQWFSPECKLPALVGTTCLCLGTGAITRSSDKTEAMTILEIVYLMVKQFIVQQLEINIT